MVLKLVSRNSDSRHNSRAAHPGWRRFASLKYAQYSQSARLAIRARRSATYAAYHCSGTLGGLRKSGGRSDLPTCRPADTIQHHFDASLARDLETWLQALTLVECSCRLTARRAHSSSRALLRGLTVGSTSVDAVWRVVSARFVFVYLRGGRGNDGCRAAAAAKDFAGQRAAG